MQSWSLAAVPGKRFGASKPVFVLTSGQTFSAGEELAYDLQAIHRATLVGDKTRGGAATILPQRLEARGGRCACRPARARSTPLTHANWEGTGVVPDVAARAAAASKDEALRRARGGA